MEALYRSVVNQLYLIFIWLRWMLQMIDIRCDEMTKTIVYQCDKPCGQRQYKWPRLWLVCFQKALWIRYTFTLFELVGGLLGCFSALKPLYYFTKSGTIRIFPFIVIWRFGWNLNLQWFGRLSILAKQSCNGQSPHGWRTTARIFTFM